MVALLFKPRTCTFLVKKDQGLISRLRDWTCRFCKSKVYFPCTCCTWRYGTVIYFPLIDLECRFFASYESWTRNVPRRRHTVCIPHLNLSGFKQHLFCVSDSKVKHRYQLCYLITYQVCGIPNICCQLLNKTAIQW